VSGQPTTIIVSNPEPTSALAPSTSSHHGGGSTLSGGAIAGIVIGSLIGAGLVMALLAWAWYLHNREYDKSPPTPESRYDPSVQNTTDNRRQSRASQMSLMPNVNGQDTMRPGGPVTDYLSPGGLAFTDNRMKKDAALYPNGGRLSTVSLQDDQDYSRPVLRVRMIFSFSLSWSISV
jgi:cell wall integrity and stress response component